MPILYQKQAIDSIHAGCGYLPIHLASLSEAYLQQFGHTEDLHDIQQAILFQLKAIDCYTYWVYRTSRSAELSWFFIYAPI